MYELVDKYLRRLDSELHKFKCELEADNKGITEVLEKRSLELDTPVTTPSITSQQQKENRYERCATESLRLRSVVSLCLLLTTKVSLLLERDDTKRSTDHRLHDSRFWFRILDTYMLRFYSSSSFRHNRPRTEKRRDSSASLPTFAEKRQAIAATVPLMEARHSAAVSTSNSTPVPPNITYNLGHIGAGQAIASAASQAIAATQQVNGQINKFKTHFYFYFHSDATGTSYGEFKSVVRGD